MQIARGALPIIDLRTARGLLLADVLDPIVVAVHVGAARVQLHTARLDGFFRVTQSGLTFAPMIAEPHALHLVELSGEARIIAGALRLPFKLAHARADLRQDVAHAIKIAARLVQFLQRLFAFVAIHRDAGRFFKERAAFVGTQRQRLIDQALADDGVGAARQAGLGQQLTYIAQTDFAAVEQIFIFAVTIGASTDNHFAEFNREETVGVIEGEIGLSHACARTAITPSENEVFCLPGAQHREDLFAQHPAQRIGDIRLAGTVWSDDSRNTRRENEVRFRGKGFKAL